MHAPIVTTRVLGAMLLTREYNHQDICIMGYPEEVTKFYLKHLWYFNV